MDSKFLRLLFVFIFAFSLGLFLQPAQVWADDDAIWDKDDSEYWLRTGTWNPSTFLPCAHGGAYQFAWGSGNTMTLDSDIGGPGGHTLPDIVGEYAVYAMWSSHPNRNNAATFRIQQNQNTIATVVRDQRFEGCKWNHLATVTLSNLGHVQVVIDSTGALNSEATIADGVRWVRVTKDSADILNDSLLDIDMADEPGMDWASGEQSVALTSTDTTVRAITVTAPTSGYVVVNASGYFDFTNMAGLDGARCSITTGTTIDFSHLIIAQDNSTAIQWLPFGATRGFSVSSGSTVYRLVCDEFAGNVNVEDTSMTGIFVPTRY
jgi:hypothetical protein